MSAISVRNLSKRFVTRQKAAGLAGSLRALVRPETREVEAVRGISFEMEPGELLGFIGPNGAGKSTTIKILTGILHPSGGEASVLGHVPWRERRALAYKIGTVFGQRPQLWYHLPALDTFYLFGKIYELDDAVVRARVRLLAEAFEIESGRAAIDWSRRGIAHVVGMTLATTEWKPEKVFKSLMDGKDDYAMKGVKVFGFTDQSIARARALVDMERRKENAASFAN